MATNTNNASTFKIVAGLTALSLVVAAALVYLQASSSGNSSASELAALSQAIPSQAARALDGEEGAFDQLDASIQRVASLRRGVVLGRSADWQQLESQASAILARRAEVEAVHKAAGQMSNDAAALLEGSNELLDRSGATAIVQEFQQRADRIRQTVAAMPAGGDGAANAIADDVAFIINVANGLGGEASDLDIRPLNAEGRETALVPLLASIASLEEQSPLLSANIGQVGDLGAIQEQLAASASTLLGSAFQSAGDGGILSALLNIPWIPIGLVGLAVLLVVGL